MNKKIRIYDFDDTLIKTNSFMYITHTDGSKLKLTPEQYAVYDALPGDEFDFSDFNGPLIQPKIIKKNFDMFTKALSKSRSDRRTVILTAREHPDPIKDFLKKKGLGDIEVIALGSSDPQKKADWIEAQIKNGYTEVAFMDDSIKNIKAVKNMARKYKYPDYFIIAKLIRP